MSDTATGASRAAPESTGPDAPERFDGIFTRQEPLPEEAIERAAALLRTGRLHRYDVPDGGGPSETSMLEREFADYQGRRHCLACASGGAAMRIALRALGVAPGDPVVTNAFTLSPVPGAIAAVGAVPVLVETTPDLVIDTDHLAERLDATGAAVLLLSHMRGHLADMDEIVRIVRARGARLVEDCAHTMGARFAGAPSGTHGELACFSTQTYKHVNSGEGGLLSGDDDDLLARAILLSGSYMLYERHGAAPPPEVFERHRLDVPNASARMDELRATILRPQLRALDANAGRWNERHAAMAEVLDAHPAIRLPRAHPAAFEVRSSLQFFTESLDARANAALVDACAERGVSVKWFGRAEPIGYTSRHDSWGYVAPSALPGTDAVLAGLHDVRLPLTFSLDDCRRVGRIVVDALDRIVDAAPGARPAAG